MKHIILILAFSMFFIGTTFSQSMAEFKERDVANLEKTIALATAQGLQSIETKCGTPLFINLSSFLNWPEQSRLKRYYVAITDTRSYTESRFPNPLFERLVITGQNDEIYFFVYLKDTSVDITIANIFKQVEEFYVNNFLYEYAKVMGESKTQTPIDRIQAIIAIPYGDGFRYLFRDYESIAYGLGNNILGVGYLEGTAVRIGDIDSIKVRDFAALDLPLLAITTKASVEKKRLDSFMVGFKRQLDWYKGTYLKGYATTREVMSTLATEDEMKALDLASVAYYLSHWSYGLSTQFPALSDVEKAAANLRLKEVMEASIGSPNGVNILSLPDDLTDPAIKYAVSSILDEFGATWDFLRENRTPKLLPGDITLILESSLDEADKQFLATLDPAKISKLKTADRYRLIEVLSKAIKWDELALSTPEAYKRFFMVMEPLILMKKDIIKGKLPKGASTTYGFNIPPLSTIEIANYLQTIMGHFPKRVAKIILALPDSMVDAYVVPFGSRNVW